MPANAAAVDSRAFRHSLRDGLTDIAMALFFLVPILIVEQPAFSWMIVLPILFFGPWLRRIRARHVWPRIGYVEPRGEQPKQLATGIVVYTLAVAATIALALVIAHGEISPALLRQVSPLLASMLFGGGLIYTARRSGMRKYLALTALSLALGACLAALDIPGRYTGLQLYLAGMGAIMLAVGVATFLSFLRDHPVREPEEAGHAD
jgi:hypothetical protein